MKELARHEHICLIDETDGERPSDLIAILIARLSASCRCVVLAGEWTQTALRRELESSGVDVVDAHQRGTLVCIPLLNQRSDRAVTFQDLPTIVRSEAVSAHAARVGEMLLLIDMDALSPSAISPQEIEIALKPGQAESNPIDRVTIIYAFNRHRSSPAVLLHALQVFPLIVVNENIEPNPYFDPSSWITTNADLELRLDHELQQLRGALTAANEDLADPEPEKPGQPLPSYRSFIESMTDPFFVVDGNQRFVYVNPVAELKWKRSRKEVLGKLLWDVFSDAIGVYGYEQIQRAARDHLPTQFEVESSVLGHWTEVSVLPHGDGLAISYRDISDRKAIEEVLSVRARQQAMVADLGRRALAGVELAAFMDEVVSSVREILDVDYVRILELMPHGRALKLVAGTGWHDGLVGQALVDAGEESHAAYTLFSNEPVVVEDFSTETRFNVPPLLYDHHVVSGLSVVIAGQERPYGVLGAHTRNKVRFTQDDVNFLQTVANIIATAIKHDRAEQLQRYYAAIVTSSEDAIIGETLDGVITSWNAAAEQVYGYSEDEVIGQPFSMLYPDDRQDEVHDILEQVRQGTRIEQYESIRLHKDGRLIDISISVSPIRDAAGRVIGVSKIVRDISERKQTEIERRADEERLQLALEAGKMGTWDWDIGNGSLSWSTNMERMHGLAPGTFGGKFEDFSRGIHSEDRDRVFQTIERTLEVGGEYHVEYRNVRSDGSIQWLEARGRIVPGGIGRSDHLTGICIDVTEQVQSRQQIARFAAAAVAERDQLQQIIDVIPEGVVITNADGHIQMSNNAARAIWGHSLNDLDVLAYELAEALLDSDETWRFEDLPISRSILSGEIVLGEQLTSRDQTTGELIQLLVNSAPLKDDRGRITAAVTTFQDITLIKEFERQKDEFLQTISHDLKNPLTSIKGNAQYLRRRARNSAEELMPIVDRIESSTNQAVALIDELLDLTRLQMGRPLDLVRKPINIDQLVRQTVEQHQATSDFHRFQILTREEELVGLLDEMRVARVLSNLISNAIKYSATQSEIMIETSSRVDGRLWAEISVHDHGIGIPADDVPLLFERFRRGSNVQGQIRGSGLGLASARLIVEQHGGTITVQSIEGQGSTFTVRLPLDEPGHMNSSS